LSRIAGVIETGLFINMASEAILGSSEGVVMLGR
jgi:ribose 5-phosphate isomerase